MSKFIFQSVKKSGIHHRRRHPVSWNSAGTWRNDNVIIKSKRSFDVIMALLLRRVSAGIWKPEQNGQYFPVSKVFCDQLLCFWLTFDWSLFSRQDSGIKWKHFPRYWPFVRGNHRSPGDFPLKGQWRGALVFSLICAWTNGWANNRDAGNLRRHGAYCDVTVIHKKTHHWLSWWLVACCLNQ